jgi:hypothetical protein
VTASGSDTPTLAAALQTAPQGQARADAAFDLGLEALLDGMRSRLPGRPGVSANPSYGFTRRNG